jgi:hypothetical protein
MCDRKVVSSDPSDWDEFMAEATGAEKYSRRLSERIRDGYAEKFKRHADPGGHAPLGFRRAAEPPHTLEVDPERIATAVGLFERYALGTVSAKDLEAETGLAESRIRCILMNPLYNGWVQRRRNGDRKPAPWQADPPVSDSLWGRVEDVRRTKTRGGGPRKRGRVDLLGGLLECVCGRRVRSDGTFADGRHRKLHPEPCLDWGTKARLGDETWEPAILAQLGAVELSDAVVAGVVAALGSNRQPVTIERGRIDRSLRDLALQHAAGAITDEAYLARSRELKQSRDQLDAGDGRTITPSRGVAWLRAFGEAVQRADLPVEQAELVHAVYERIGVAGSRGRGSSVLD